MLTLEEAERAHILAVLEHVAGNQSHAAKILGIGRNTLARKLKTYGL
jgi:DNA-binding protein Fis